MRIAFAGVGRFVFGICIKRGAGAQRVLLGVLGVCFVLWVKIVM